MVAGEQDSDVRLLEILALLAPGTPLRDGLERILRGRTGALVVLGHGRAVQQLSTGGFELSVPFSPTALRELAKMDGAIVVTRDLGQIVAAGVQLMPNADLDTAETGTRHRTADRVSRQTGVPVVSVSASMSTIALYLDQRRHLVENSAQILSRANQALQTLERYRVRLGEVTRRLSTLEIEDQVTIRDLALVAQRLEMIRRLDHELSGYVVELGTDGRLLRLQLHELSAGTDDLRQLLDQDYRPSGEDTPFGLGGLGQLGATELLDPSNVARALGFAGHEHLDTRITPRGHRQLAQINRLPTAYADRLIERFGHLQAVLGASSAELQEIDGVGASRARIIREGLTRLAESAYS